MVFIVSYMQNQDPSNQIFGISVTIAPTKLQSTFSIGLGQISRSSHLATRFLSLEGVSLDALPL